MRWRDRVRENDRLAIRELVTSTSFFTPAEQDIAVELVDDALRLGRASGYEFIFAHADNAAAELLGYACFGPVPSQDGLFDLYWIAVSPTRQRQGIGEALLREAERRAHEQGAAEMSIDTSGRAQYLPTRAFYERMGYARHEVLRDFYASGDDKVVYRRRLA